MLKLKSLTFALIGRFQETQTINFDDFGNLIQVDAVRNDTGSSSGAGKSTIFKALDYNLGLNDLPIGTLQTRGTTEGTIYTSGKYDWDGIEIKITRSKAKGLIIELPTGKIEGSSKLSEEKLDEILGIPRHLFRKILHKRQKEGGFFLEFTPKQINDFLTDCLGLTFYKNRLDKNDNKIKELELQKQVLDKELISVRSAITATQDAVLMLGIAPVRDMHRETILTLKEKLDKSIKELEILNLSQKLEYDALESIRPNISVSTFDHTLLDQYEESQLSIIKDTQAIQQEEKNRIVNVNMAINKIKSQKKELERDVYAGDVAHNKAIEKALEIKKVLSNVCPTCDQDWTNESIKLKEYELLQQLKELKEEIKKGQNSKQELVSLEVSLDDLNNQLTPIKDPKINELNSKFFALSELIIDEKDKRNKHNYTENLKNKNILDQFNNRQKELKDRHFLQSEQLRGQVHINSVAFESAVSKLRAFEQAKKKYDDNFQLLNEKLDLLNLKNIELDNKIKLLDSKLELAVEAKRAIKSYINHCFDDALETIGEMATSIIRNIPNMANATITLKALNETKEGKIKEEVNTVIDMDGDLDIPIDSLSGGERTSTDIAVDLSVIDFIESKTGKGINLFILDEPFGGAIGPIEIESIIEMLKNNNVNRKIVIVDHNPVVKEMVSDRIIVVRDGLTSRIEGKNVQ